MGWGDEIIATGQAKAKQAAGDMRLVRILGADKQPRWHALWEGSKRIVSQGRSGDFHWVINGPSARPYIVAKAHDRWTWRNFICTPGEIVFNRVEKAFAAQFSPTDRKSVV